MAEEFITIINEIEKRGPIRPATSIQPWKILVADDDPEVHSVTKFVLNDLIILGRPLLLIYAESGIEARARLVENPDVAISILDVVMESEQAGLELVKYIREELKYGENRIILRTGQPGYAPELSVIQNYDINDYRTKDELTHTKLITAVSTALRSYEQLHAIAEHRRGLELIIRSAADLLEQHAIADLSEGVLTQLASLLKLSPNGIVCTQRGSPLNNDTEGTYVVGASGKHARYIAQPLETLPDPRIVSAIQQSMKKRHHLFNDDYTVLYLQTAPHQDASIFLDSGQPLSNLDRQLLDVFVSNIAACFRNVKLVESLNYIAYHDPLTGLLNRPGFIAAIENFHSSGQNKVVALLDLYHFTDLNDGLGQDFGDALLVTVSRRIRSHIARDCELARIASDVFGIIGPEEAIKVDSLVNLFNEPFEVGEYHLPIAVSVGICGASDTKVTGIDILKRANIALNKSKKMPPMQHEYFVQGMEDIIRQRVETIRKLRTAFLTGKLEVWYQPQISLETGQVIGAEALLRWPEGAGFACPPGIFIPLAEYSGLIIEIGAWVLDQACVKCAELAEVGFRELRIAVNVSMPQFQKQDFPEIVSAILKRHKIPSANIELEITESIAMNDPEIVKERLNSLKALGLQIAVDDFGTGYSSLGQLQALPIDCLKIDRSFVTEITKEKGGMFAEAIVNFCKKLNVLSIAEGVETPEQADFLRDLGCDIAQGYLYSKPLSSSQFLDWLRKQDSNRKWY